jgi:F-type H+-transporting ATPase subunit gamma
MPSLKDLRIRINSVKSTQKITSAMKMVAAAKLRKAQSSAEAGRPYAASMEQMLSGLVASAPEGGSGPPLLSGTGSDTKHLLVLVTGDRGLCAGFNSSIVREGRRQVEALTRAGKSVEIVCIGRKGRDGIKRDHASKIRHTIENATRDGADYAAAREMSRRLITMYDAGEFDVCTIIFNTFKSAISQIVTVKQIVPFPATELLSEGQAPMSASDALYEMEPSDDVVLEELLPANLAMQIFRSFLESYASEQGARMTAMDNATRNAGEMIDKLTLTYNRSRQAMITKELIEIISGAEAV